MSGRLACAWLYAAFVSAAACARAALPDEHAMAQRVDAWLAAGWERAGVLPAPPADDATFLRRVTLDLTGLIPTAFQVQAFLADTSPDKRSRLIDELLASPAHANHLANLWLHMLIPQDALSQQRESARALQAYLRLAIVDNRRYDVLVADLLTATGDARDAPAVLFYTSRDLKAEELAAATSRLFLGLHLECAQCHDHPFDRWKQRDFWGLAAFFARVRRPAGPRGAAQRLIDAETGEVNLPDSNQAATPAFPGNSTAISATDPNRRRLLALWMVSRDNPYFARAAVNRVWAQLFGRGLVEPIDDLAEHNPPSHPELLAELAAYFVASGYDLRALYRALANSRAYQLSSKVGTVHPPPELFASMALKPMRAEQLFDCLVRATRRPLAYAPSGELPGSGDMLRDAFVARFQSALVRPGEFAAGIPQVLTLMNGTLVQELTSPESSGLLQSLEAPYLDDAQRIDLLTLSVLSRWPTHDERAGWLAYLAEGAPSDRRQRLADILWAQVNSVEFIFNH